MNENEIGERVLGCALMVHRNLGPGLLESTYEACLAHELRKIEMSYQRQLTLPLVYDGEVIETGYRLDLLRTRVTRFPCRRPFAFRRKRRSIPCRR